MSVESEGWATFAMIGSMVLINPYIMALTQVPEISERVSVDALVWTTPAVAILASLVVLSLAVIGLTRSEEHTSELQSLMRSSYAVFCLKKKNNQIINQNHCKHTS